MVCMLTKQNLCNCGCEGFHTFQTVFAIVAWSMRLLRDGLAPTKRHDGSAWTGWDKRHRLPNLTPLPLAALLQIRGDWEWMCQAYRFRKANELTFCWLCNATLHTYMNEFHRDAPHRRCLRDHYQFLKEAVAVGLTLSTILGSPGLQLKHFALDSMHGFDLGPVLDAIGSLLWIEINCKTWYSTQQVGLRKVNEELMNYYRANQHLTPVQLVKAQLRSTTNPYPVLKAKAAQAKHMCHYCRIVAHRQAGHSGRVAYAFKAGHRLAGLEATYHARIVDLFEGACDYYSGIAAPVLDKVAIENSMYRFLQALVALNRLWRTGLTTEAERMKMPFHIRPKCHMDQHLVSDQLEVWGSPKCFSCYNDESFMGSIKLMCRCSSQPSTLEETAMSKCRLLAGVETELAKE